MTVILIIALLLGLCAYKDIKINQLKDQLTIKQSENLSLKRVMYENDLIPEEYVK